MPRALAARLMASIRQLGMRPLAFQLDTVEGVIFRADATALVPPNASMMLDAVFMPNTYDNRNYLARANLRCS